jgi:hypothetical protein
MGKGCKMKQPPASASICYPRQFAARWVPGSPPSEEATPDALHALERAAEASARVGVYAPRRRESERAA